MKGFKQGTLGTEVTYKTFQTARLDPNPRPQRLLRVPTPSESEQYEEEHLIPMNVTRRREVAIDNIFDRKEEDEGELSDSKVFLHPDQSSGESDLNLPYIDPEERAEHRYNGFTPQDPEFWK